MRKIERYINNIRIDGVLAYRKEIDEQDVELEDWEEIEPKYYIDKSDDMIFEIWYDKTGLILDRGLNTHLKNDAISTDWAIKRFEEISKESAMIKYNERILRKEQRLVKLDSEEKQKLVSYNNKNLMQRDKQNNGGSSDWYLLPENAKTLQDLIEHRNMNGAVKDIFKACYRLGIKTEDELRDLNKTAYYALREIGRVSGRKDYITIAKELIGSQAIEDYCTCEECNGKCNGDCMI